MNAIEKRFYNELLKTIKSGYILQHEKGHYKIVGETLLAPDEENCSESDNYIQIPYKIFLDKNLKNTGRIDLYLTIQTPIGGYKLDFLFAVDVPNISCAIEIDGHDWHEKTKDQASTDKKRERKLLSLGIPCMRFTGSDVFTNPDGCAKEALDIFFNYYFLVLLSTPENWDYYLRNYQ